MLAMADRDGRIWASVPGLAKRAGVDLKECEEALKTFLAPDEWSRTKECAGRRIRAVDGGWELLNHAKYRAMLSADERREYMREKQAEYRRRRKSLKREAGCEGAQEAIKDGLAEAQIEPDTEPEPEEVSESLE
jgi:hypothetical protein